MLKFVVCILFVSFACAAPGYVGHYPEAVSHVARVDIHDSKPLGGYESPLGYAPVAYAPSVGYAPGGVYGGYGSGHYGGYGSGHYGGYGSGHYGGYGSGHYGGYGAGHYGYPPAQSYSNRIDVHSASAPVLASPYGHGYGGYGIHDGNGYGHAVHGYGIHGLHHGY